MDTAETAETKKSRTNRGNLTIRVHREEMARIARNARPKIRFMSLPLSQQIVPMDSIPSPIIATNMSSAELFGPALHRSLAGILQRYLSHRYSCLLDDFSVNSDGKSTSRHGRLDRWPASLHAQSISHPLLASRGERACGLRRPGSPPGPLHAGPSGPCRKPRPSGQKRQRSPTFREIMRGVAPRGLHPSAAALHRGATLMAGGLGDSVLSRRTVYNDLT